MTATGHAVIGVAIAAVFPNPFIAIPLAVGSHVLADLFPHWDAGTNRDKKSKDRFLKEAVVDVLLSWAITFVLVTFLFPQTSLLYAYVIVFASQFLDWAMAPYVFFRIKNPPIFMWIYEFQQKTNTKLDKPWGIIGQVAILVFLIVLAVNLSTPSAIATP